MSTPRYDYSRQTTLQNATNQTSSVPEEPPTALSLLFFWVVTFPTFRAGCQMKLSCNYSSLFLNYKSSASEWGSSPVKAGATCSGKLVPRVLYLRRISWSFISNSVSVPWNNMRLAVTESRLLCCQCRFQVSIHLSALINYTSQWQITPHSFVCSHMHANKRIRYQSKLIYSYEDGVPTVHSEINACTQWHQPAWQLSQYSSLPVTLFPPI